jgi:protein involved in polysaccharide export with SLBB domain
MLTEMARRVLLVLLCLACIGASGCAGPALIHEDYAAFVREPRPSVPGQDYRLGVPDVVAIEFLSDDDVTTYHLTLAADGTVRVPRYGRLAAADRTCAALADSLNAWAERDERIESVGVRVQTFAARQVFVFGQVERPGPQAYHGANSVLDTLSHARLSPRADPRRVEVLRPSADGELRRKLTVDLEAMVRGGDTTLDVVLAEGDVVFVPATGLGRVGLALEQVFGSKPTRAAEADPAPAPASTTVVIDPDPVAARRWAALHESVDQLHEQLVAMRADHADQMAALTEAFETNHDATSNVVWRDEPGAAVGVMPTAAEFDRGGTGERPPPRGVRFWGP